MDPPTAIHRASQLKLQGNELIKQKDFKKALVSYHSSYMHLHGFPNNMHKPTDEQRDKIQKLKAEDFANIALCHLKLENYHKAVEYAEKATQIEPLNAKCLFRRGKALAALGQLDEAKADFDKVITIDVGNREAHSQLRAIKTRLVECRKHEQRKFSGFFEKLRLAEETSSNFGASSVSSAVELGEQDDTSMAEVVASKVGDYAVGALDSVAATVSETDPADQRSEPMEFTPSNARFQVILPDQSFT